MRSSDALRHVHEEGREVGVEPHGLVGRRHGLHVLGSHLLGEQDTRPLLRPHRREDLGHEFAEELCTLAAAKDEQAECAEGRVRGTLLLQCNVAHRIAGESKLGLRLGRQAKKCRERRSHSIRPLGEHAVGTAHHRVLIMHAGGYLQPRRRQDRREGRIAPKANHRERLHALEDVARRAIATIEAKCPTGHQPRLRQRKRGRGNDMRLGGGKGLPIVPHAFVRHQVDGIAAARQLLRQRLSRKQVSAGAARREDEGSFAHQAYDTLSSGTLERTPKRLRPSARTSPMPKAIPISDEPP